MRITFDWTDEKIAELRHYWNFERLPTSTIGNILGVSKNAIIGKAYRLRLEPKPGDNRASERKIKQPMPRILSRKTVRPPAPITPEPEVLALDKNVTIRELHAHHCREIIGREEGEPIYCGARRMTYLNRYDRVVRSPYCPVHHAINHQPDRGISHGYRERSYR